MRQVKKPEERRLEILRTAEKLFAKYGYAGTSVDAIIKEMGVAKGTFYYYFKSKEQVLEAIVDVTLAQIVTMTQQVADAPGLSALDKMQMLLSDSHIGEENTLEIAEHLHLPSNRELHELTNIQTVLQLSPIFAQIVEQGIEEKVFNALRPLETVQFLLTSSQFLLDGGLFDFSVDEITQRKIVIQEMTEKALGASPGSFSFMSTNSAKEE